MQDKYVSLNPEYAEKVQSRRDRRHLYNQRYLEAQGGPYARAFGILSGLTAASYFYTRAQRNGFTGFFPLQRQNAGSIALILGAGFVAYNFGHKLVATVTGDPAQLVYLMRNKRQII